MSRTSSSTRLVGGAGGNNRDGRGNRLRLRLLDQSGWTASPPAGRIVIIDLNFPLRGDPIPSDHGFALYGAISGLLPELHASTDYGIHPVVGTLLPARRTALTGRSRLVIRSDHTRLPRFLPLAGRSLRIGDAVVRVGVPATRSLRSSQAVASRLVVIKGFLEPEGFLDAVRRQLHDLDIKASAELLQRPAGRRFEGRSDSSGGGPVRRTVSIHGKQVVGFPVRVQDLEASASVRLQEVGIGGRRRFGCGIFVPVRSQ